MKFFDFYMFQGHASIGTVTILGTLASLAVVLALFWGKGEVIKMRQEKVRVDYVPLFIFIAGVVVLAFAPYYNVSPGLIGLGAGAACLLYKRRESVKVMKEFDWNTFLFIIGIFIVVSSLETTGLLNDMAAYFEGFGFENSAVVLAGVIWFSVIASSFIDHVPFTVFMIPLCTHLASVFSVNPFALIFGMLLGMGFGGNILPVGSSANIFAIGLLEKSGIKVKTSEYVKISLPFSVAAVAVGHILIQLIWL
jgi:Na+/H+ antiporter NhaD/arsenite permease-like protein